MKRKQNLCFIITVAICGVIMIALCQPGVLAKIRELQQAALRSASEAWSDVANPEDPTNPANPEDPTNPANPEDPTDPANPEDPTDPANPGNITLEIFDGDTMDVYVSAGVKTYIRFVAPGSGRYVLYSTGDQDTYGYLYAADARTELTRNDDYNDLNFRLEYDLTAGNTYFFAVEFYGGWQSGTISVTLEHVHVWDDGVVTKEPSCTEYGTVLHTCAVCGETYTETIPFRHTDENGDGICDLCGAEVIAVVETGKCGDWLTYTLYENGLLEISGMGDMYDYAWDSSTWSNSTSVFDHDTRIRSVVIQNGVTNIGDYAFCYCTALEEISIPETVTKIRNNAFAYCSRIEEITVPESVEMILSYAFNGCSSLKTVHLNSGLQRIESYAFSDCPKLADIAFPDSLSYIGSDIFWGSNLIKSVALPQSTAYVDSSFGNSLAAIYIYSADCELYGSAIAPETVIYGYAGSTAQAYAEENGNLFFLLESREVTGIEIVSLPDQLEQPNGVDPDYTGLTIRASFADGTSALLTDSFAVYRNRSTVTVLYYGYTAQFEITLVPAQAYEDVDLYLSFSAYDTDQDTFFISFTPEKSIEYRISLGIHDSYSSSAYLRLFNADRSQSLAQGQGSFSYVFEAGKEYFIRINLPYYYTKTYRYCFTVTHVHNWSNPYTLREATCARAGITESVCSVCGAKTQQSFARTEHVDANGDSRCDICGGAYTYAVESGVCGNNASWILYSDGTLDICGSGYVWDQMDHWGFWPTSGTPAVTVVTEPGITGINYLSLSGLPIQTLYLSDTVTYFNMNDFWHEYLTDIYYAGSEAQWAEIDFGYQSWPDENITVHYNSDLTPCEHKWDAGEQTQAPDCEHFGIITYTCEVCGGKRAEASVPPLGHDYIEHEAKAATCTEPGWNAYRTCSRCDFSDYLEIPPAHTDADENGICDICGAEITIEHTDLNGDDICDNCGIPLDPRYHKIGENAYYRIVGDESGADVLWIAGSGPLDDSWKDDIIGESELWGYYYSTIRIGKGITYIPDGEFERNTEYKAIIVEEGNPVYHSDNNNLIETESKTLLLGCKNSIIPDDGSVTQIAGSAFSGSEIHELTIPEGVERIGNYTFYDCKELRSILLPGSLTSIGSNSFYRCSGLTELSVSPENPVYTAKNNCLIESASNTLLLCCIDAEIPDDGSVTRIGSGAFSAYGRTDVSVSIPKSVESISAGAFSRWSYRSLETYILNSTCEIEENAIFPEAVIHGYAGSTAQSYAEAHGNTFILIEEKEIDHIEISSLPDKTQYVQTEPFSSEGLLVKVIYTDETFAIRDNGYTLTGYDTNAPGDQTVILQYMGFETSFVITVEAMPENVIAFGSCGETVSWTLYKDGTLEISGTGPMDNYNPEEIEFWDSNPDMAPPWWDLRNQIQRIVLDEGVTSIGSSAFVQCRNATSVDIGSDVNTIGESAFDSCTELISVSFPESLTSIEYRAFSDCTNLTEITIPRNVTNIADRVFEGCSALETINVNDGNTVYHADGNCLIETASKTLISGCKTSVIPSDGSVTSIGASAFYHCSDLTEIVIPDTITRIGRSAFSDCTELRSIVIPNSVTIIEADTFYRCTNLEAVELPDSVTVIEAGTFYDCTALSSVLIGNGITSIGISAFGFTGLTEIRIPDGVTSIGIGAFAGCSSLESIYMPTSVESIAFWAFSRCENLQSVYFAGSEEEWGEITIRSGNENLLNATIYYNTNMHEHIWDEGIIITPASCNGTGIKTYTCTVCGEIKTEELPALGHDYVDHTAKAATCTEIGWKAYQTCSRCDYTTYVEIPAQGHDLVDHEAKAATCTAIGWDAYQTCSRCDYTTYVEIPAQGHDLVDHEAKAATCTAIGWDAYQTCSRCDYTTYAEIPAQGHDLVDHEAKAATCTAIGWDAYQTCSRCDYTTYVEIPAKGHDLIDHEAKAATCTAIGWDAYQTCSRCDYTTYVEIPAQGHDLVDHEAKAATCTAIGWDAYQTCSRCDYTTYVEIPAQGHDLVDHEAKAATCTAIGWDAYQTCSRCDYTTYVEIPAQGHDLVDHEAKAATCTAIGWDAYQTCSRCDYTTYVEIPAKGHDLIDHEAKAATCTAIGWDAYQTCSRCDYTTYAEIPAKGHDLVDHEAKEATCTAIGWDAYQTCSRCDYTTYAEIPAQGHDLVDHEAKAATCTAIGWDAYQTCSRCDYTTYAEIPAKGHDLVNHEAKAATCTAIGWDAYQTCSRCDYSTYEEIAALGHDFGEWEQTKPASCTESGEEKRTCARCDAAETRTVDALNHNFTVLQSDAAYHWYACVNGCGMCTEKEAHSFGAWITEVPATTEQEGTAYRICSECQFRETKALPKEAEAYLFGDVDHDGQVTSADARLALRRAVLLESYEEGSYEFFVSDVDFDGKVTAMDARLILRAAVDLEDPNAWLEAYKASVGDTTGAPSLSPDDTEDRSAGTEPADALPALYVSPVLSDDAQTADNTDTSAADAAADAAPTQGKDYLIPDKPSASEAAYED